MDINAAFDTLQTEVDVHDRADKKARARRDLFRKALGPEADVLEVFPSGSLARGSQISPIHDVDLVAVYDPEAHPDWGQDGDSAADALAYTHEQIRSLLGTDGSYAAGEVRLIHDKNHSVKCFLDDPDEVELAFTVDVVPALRHNGHLLIPEARNAKWVESDPEHLIELVRNRHADWNRFVPLVRALKRWNKDKGAGMKSLAIEVLALDFLPEETRPKALSRFFNAAASRIQEPICDPAGLCGEIDPNMDRELAYEKLDAAASAAYQAVNAQDLGDTDKAACLWRDVFGDIFPEPECGCSTGTDTGTGTGLLIGIGGSTGVVDKPRPVVDAPQG